MGKVGRCANETASTWEIRGKTKVKSTLLKMCYSNKETTLRAILFNGVKNY